MFSLNDTILRRGVRTSGMVDNVTISTKGTERGLDKLLSVIGMNNLRCSGILSDNFRDEVGDRSDNLRVVVEKVDPTHMSVIINKHDILAVTRNRGGTRGTLTNRDRVVGENTRSRVKIKSKLTNFKDNSRIEGYNGKYGSNPQ